MVDCMCVMGGVVVVFLGGDVDCVGVCLVRCV